MLLMLTTKCEMNCPHCMNNASPNGINMSGETWKASLDFIVRMNPSFLSVTGGEFTEHPAFYEIILELRERMPDLLIMLLTNGMFIQDSKKTNQIKHLLSFPQIPYLQITTGSPIYPKTNLIISREAELKAISPKIIINQYQEDFILLGRATKNFPKKPSPKRHPFCSNLYLLPKQGVVTTLKDMIFFLQNFTRFNWCKPTIDPEGNLLAGESIECMKIGSVKSSDAEIFEYLLRNKPCNKCGLISHLPARAFQLFAQFCH